MGIQGLQPWLSPWAEALIRHFPRLKLSSTYRSYTEQLALYRNRRRNPYPVAPPGRSYHQFGRAFDLNGPRDDLYRAGAAWRSWGGTWSEQDEIHFQA